MLPDPKIANVAQQISDYLEAHPRAADSVEGVTRWWLTRQQFEHAVINVQLALDYLVAEGIVKKTRSATGRMVYSRSRCKSEKLDSNGGA